MSYFKSICDVLNFDILMFAFVFLLRVNRRFGMQNLVIPANWIVG